VYVQNVVNNPLLTNKGEIQLAVNTDIAGIDPRFAYLLSNRIGVMLNGSFANRISDTTNNFHKHKFMEIGSGYYTHIGARGKFETLSGVGSGTVQANYKNNLWTSRSKVNFTRYFIQPTIGFTTNIFDTGFSSQFVILNFHQETGSSTSYFVEPVVTTKLGYNHFKAILQLGLSFPLNSDSIQFNYQPLLL
jgi:hypothetical protein